MNASIILPIPHLDLAKGREYHLVLAHLLSYPKYLGFYAQEVEKGSYVILDNSAHEYQVGQVVSALINWIPYLHPSELVIPDHLFDATDTLRLFLQSIYFIVHSLPEPVDVRWMFVPQGTDYQSWKACLTRMVAIAVKAREKHPDRFAKGYTIGLSKDYEVWDGGIYKLLQEDILPAADELNAEIHMLGWGRNLWALQKVQSDLGSRIRSIDSAKPVMYGINQIWLNPYKDAPQYPKRSKDYFQSSLSYDQLQAAKWNISIFDRVVAGEFIPEQPTESLEI